jgi:integrase
MVPDGLRYTRSIEARCNMQDSTRRKSRGKASPASKPKKPRADFPLSIHKGAQRWCKKVRGRVHYFGKVADDPNGAAALEKWLEQKDALLAGREPREISDALTVADLANRYLTHKIHLRDNGELSPRTFQGYFATCETVVESLRKERLVIDLMPDDFRKLRAKLAKKRGMVALRNEMQRVRGIFKFAFDERLIPTPVVFGQAFAKPKLEAVRRARESHRATHGDRMLEGAELRVVLAKAGQPMKAMVLLGINCGFGQTDLSSLPLRAVDLDKAWVDYPRPKTSVPRRCPLWPETVGAIRAWLKVRPEAKDKADASLLFLTQNGRRWVKLNASGSPADALGQEFAKLLVELKLKRKGLSFYGLRHGFETIAGETADQVAVDAIMGHVPQGMSALYRERIGEDRLRRVAEHVRRWLFDIADDPAPSADKPKSTKPKRRPRKQSAAPVESSDARPSLRIVG